MHDLTSNDSGSSTFIATESNVRSIWDAIGSDSRSKVLGHVNESGAGIDFIQAGMESYPSDNDFSKDSAYQQSLERKLDLYSHTNYNSLPNSVKSFVKESLVEQGYIGAKAYENDDFIDFMDDKDEEDYKKSEELDEEDEEEAEENEDEVIDPTDRDITEEKLKHARKIIKAIEADYVGFPRDTEKMVKKDAATKSEPEDIKEKKGMDYNPNKELYDNKIFKEGSATSRYGLEVKQGERFIAENIFTKLTASEKDEVRYSIYPDRIYNEYNVTEGVEYYLTYKAKEAIRLLQALEQEEEKTCPYCNTKFNDKTEMQHHKKDHVEETIPAFLTDDKEEKAEETDEDRVGTGIPTHDSKMYGEDKAEMEKSQEDAVQEAIYGREGEEGTHDDLKKLEESTPDFLKDVDFSKDKLKVDANEAQLPEEDLTVEETDDTPEGYDKEDKKEDLDIKEVIIERKLDGYPEHSIIREVELWSDISREAAEALVRSTGVSDKDYEAHTLFGKRYNKLDADERKEMKLYGGEAMKEAGESYKPRGKNNV